MRELARARLSEMAIRIPSIDTDVALLSGGQRQAIAVARAVFSDARVILLDEPLAAMGAKESLVILDLIRELKRRGDVSIIMIAHNYAQIVDVCDRVNLLQHGRITYDRAVERDLRAASSPSSSRPTTATRHRPDGPATHDDRRSMPIAVPYPPTGC